MAIKTSVGKANQYTKYKNGNVFAKNRARKLAKLIKQNPNNLQLVTAAKSIVWRRKTPKNPMWSSSKRREVEIAKLFKVPEGFKVPEWKHKQSFDNMWLRASIKIGGA